MVCYSGAAIVANNDDSLVFNLAFDERGNQFLKCLYDEQTYANLVVEGWCCAVSVAREVGDETWVRGEEGNYVPPSVALMSSE